MYLFCYKIVFLPKHVKKGSRFLGLFWKRKAHGTAELHKTGPGCSKLATSLVNVSSKCQMFPSQNLYASIFGRKNLRSFALQKLFSFIQQKISVYLVIKS